MELEAALAQVNGRLIEATQRADQAERHLAASDRAMETLSEFVADADKQIALLTAQLHAATVSAREADERYHRLAAQMGAGATSVNPDVLP